MILEGITPSEYEVMLAVRGDRAGARFYYLEGALEIVSPSQFHEQIKKTLARLFEAYLDEHRIKAEGLGSMTMRSAPKRRGAEPDECYRLSESRSGFPDIAIEVNWTSGGLDKLEIYLGLQVREVWIWEDGTFEPHVLRGDRYERAARSELLPDLDLGELARFADQHESQSEAVWAYRDMLRARRGGG